MCSCYGRWSVHGGLCRTPGSPGLWVAPGAPPTVRIAARCDVPSGSTITKEGTMTPPPAAAPTEQSSAAWAGVVSLSLGIFAIVMSEFLPASLLPRIADGLGVSEGL